MWPMILPVLIGGALGSALGYFGQCSSGTCPLTSTWWRGALYGAALGALVGVGSRSGFSAGGHAAADSTNLLHLSPAEFDAQVLHSPRPVLVDFYAPWCGPCNQLAPTVAKLADAFAGQATVAKINVDEAAQLADRYQIEGIPTLLFFKQGKVADSVMGLATEQELKSKLQALVSAMPPKPKVEARNPGAGI